MMSLMHMFMDAHEDNEVDGTLLSGDLGTIIAVLVIALILVLIFYFIGRSRDRW